MAEIYRRHGGTVYRYSLRLLQDEAGAEEVTQEVFLALLKEAGRFDPARGALGTWLCGIARRLVWKQLHHRARYLPMDEAAAEEVECPVEDPAELFDQKEALHWMEQQLALLPAELREVIVLCDLEEMPYEQVAGIMGVPIGTVRSRRHRAVRRMAAALKGERCASHE